MSQADITFESIVWMLRALSDSEREKFLDRLAAIFCRHCGIVLATLSTGRCPCVRDE